MGFLKAATLWIWHSSMIIFQASDNYNIRFHLEFKGFMRVTMESEWTSSLCWVDTNLTFVTPALPCLVHIDCMAYLLPRYFLLPSTCGSFLRVGFMLMFSWKLKILLPKFSIDWDNLISTILALNHTFSNSSQSVSKKIAFLLLVAFFKKKSRIKESLWYIVGLQNLLRYCWMDDFNKFLKAH